MRDAVRKPWEAAVPVGQANRQWGDSGRASASLDDVPHRLRLPSYPADRLPDLYGSIIRTFGMRYSRPGSELDAAGPLPYNPARTGQGLARLVI